MRIINVTVTKDWTQVVTSTGDMKKIKPGAVGNIFINKLVIPNLLSKGYFDCEEDDLKYEPSLVQLLKDNDIEIPYGIDISQSEQIIREAVDSGNSKGVQNLLDSLKSVIRERQFSVESCMAFLENTDLPITPEGNILGYKYLDKDGDWLIDCHTHSIKQKPGWMVSMGIEQVDPDRSKECSYGLHVASLDYLRHFNGDVLCLVLVDPRDIIAVPFGESTKVRVCRYVVLDQLTPEQEEIVSEGGHLDDEYITKWVNCADAIKPEGITIIFPDGSTELESFVDIPQSLAKEEPDITITIKTKHVKRKKDIPEEKNDIDALVDMINKEVCKNILSKKKISKEDWVSIEKFRRKRKQSLKVLFKDIWNKDLEKQYKKFKENA